MLPCSRVLVTVLLALTATACANDAPQASVDAAATAARPGAVEMVDGVQVVTLTAGPTGFVPNEITLTAGVPARFVVTRTDPSTCLEQIQLADFGLEPVDLPLNEPVRFDVMPTETGTFTFVCGMEMQQGTIVVTA
ncbi:MAG: cupredoxin domain-containing protein [Bacteroidota bacterium]